MKAAHADRPLRWLRLLAIATGAVILASCRSLPTPAVVSTATVTMLPEPNPAATGAAPAAPAPPRTGDDASDWEADVRRADGSAAFGGIERTGLEAPCPALPRLEAAAPAGCRDGQCAVGICPPQVCIPCDRPPPLVGPYLVCDGGDACAPARPRGADGLANLTAGDTVARYRAAGDGPDAADVCIAVSNCACVYAPRFGSVREVVRPFEDAAPQGPRGLALDTLAGEQTRREPVWGSTQNVAVEAARKALPGVAVEENLGPLAVDQGDMPHEDDGVIGPAERVSPYEALRAVTAHAAWQIKEEKTKGTLEVGKLADLVILERNPLRVDPATIKDIAVQETIKEGRTIFLRESDGARSQAMAGGSSLPCLHDHDHGAPPALTASARGTLKLLVRAAQQ